jgi:sortase B
MAKRKMWVLLIGEFITIAIVLVSLIGGAYTYINSKHESREYQEVVTQYTSQTQSSANIDTDVITTPAETDAVVTSPEYEINADFDALKDVNDNVVAWLAIPDTDINYPVVQGRDNSTYLSLNWAGEKARGGAAFLDFREEADTASNYIIYGHAMGVSSTTMFSGLLKYKDSGYITEHPSIYMSFADDPIAATQLDESGDEYNAGEYEFRIYSVVMADTGDDDTINDYYWFEADNATLQERYEACKSESIYEIDSEGTPYKLVTLSTCAYPGTGSNIKLLVCGAIYEESLKLD